eukprot:4580743-Prymnesium_polylepis.1
MKARGTVASFAALRVPARVPVRVRRPRRPVAHTHTSYLVRQVSAPRTKRQLAGSSVLQKCSKCLCTHDPKSQ